MNDTYQTVQPVIARVQRMALTAAVVGGILSVVALIVNPVQFFPSYLVAFLYCFGLSFGCLVFSMIHYLGGGGWGAAIGDVLRSGAWLMWLVAIMFVPIVLGAHYIYIWSDPAVIAADPLLHHKQVWFSMPVWTGRAIFYLAIWILLAYFLDKWFRAWDSSGSPSDRRNLRNLSGFGMALLILSASFAMFDWVMSLEPEWSSTIYGLMTLTGHVLAGWAFAIFVLTQLRDLEPVRTFASWRLWQDLGSLLLANVILWAYASFDQFMLIWIGNLNDEIPWYLRRMSNGWEDVGTVIIIAQFAIPFLALVQRGVRRSPVALGWIAALLFVSRYVEDLLLVEPDFKPTGLITHWPDVALLLALGGIWLVLFCRQLQNRLVVVRPAAIFAEHAGQARAQRHPHSSIESERGPA